MDANYSITGTDFAAVEAAANDYVCESNTADFAGTPVTGFVIDTVEGIYGVSYVAIFTVPYTIIAGERFYAGLGAAA